MKTLELNADEAIDILSSRHAEESAKDGVAAGRVLSGSNAAEQRGQRHEIEGGRLRRWEGISSRVA